MSFEGFFKRSKVAEEDTKGAAAQATDPEAEALIAKMNAELPPDEPREAEYPHHELKHPVRTDAEQQAHFEAGKNPHGYSKVGESTPPLKLSNEMRVDEEDDDSDATAAKFAAQ